MLRKKSKCSRYVSIAAHDAALADTRSARAPKYLMLFTSERDAVDARAAKEMRAINSENIYEKGELFSWCGFPGLKFAAGLGSHIMPSNSLGPSSPLLSRATRLCLEAFFLRFPVP
jgi:hypothetical protein